MPELEEPLEQATAMERSADPALGEVGTCFGYQVLSGLTFHYLRGGSGETTIEVVEDDGPDPETMEPPIQEWLPRPRNPLHARLFEAGRGYVLWIDGIGWYRVDPSAPSIAVPASSPNRIRREEHVWGIPAALCFLRRGDLPIHAAAVEVDGWALLLAAPGKFGKTTLAGALLRAGHRLLAEDISCCRLSPHPQMLPGPAMLRVRRDVHDRLDFPGTSLLWEDAARAHLAIDPSLRGDGSPVPIRGIVFLRPGEDDVVMEPVAPAAALPDLWTLTLKMPTDADRALCFRGVADLAARVSIWNLYRPLRLDQLERTIERIASTCLPA